MREAIIRALRLALGTALAALTLGLAAPALASDYYLTMEGIEGEAQGHERADTLEVLSWSWGEARKRWSAEREVRSRPDGDGAGMVRLLVRAGRCQRGARYRMAMIGTGDGVHTLHDVTVASCIAQRDFADRPTEEIALNYRRIE